MLNSVIVTALALIILVAVAIPAAYVLARFKFPGSKLINTLLRVDYSLTLTILLFQSS